MESYLRPNVFIFNRQMDRAMKRGEKKKDLVEAWRTLLGDAFFLFFLAPRDPSRSMMRAFGAERGSIVHNRDPLLSAVAYQTLLRIFPSMSFR